MTYRSLTEAEITTGDTIRADFTNGTITNLRNNKSIKADPFNDVQMEIYLKGGLLGK
jgi:3-isopropylmalate dehydratase small subunit